MVIQVNAFNPTMVASILLDNPDSRETMLALLNKTQVKQVDVEVDRIRAERAAAERAAALEAGRSVLRKRCNPDSTDDEIDTLFGILSDLASVMEILTPVKGEPGGWTGYTLNPGVKVPGGTVKVIYTTATKK